jgi:regulator of sigma E protease
VSLTTANGSKTLTLTLAAAKANQSMDETLGLRLYSQGLLVQMVLPDGAASKAGLRAADVMVRINGVVIDHPAVLISALQQYQKDQSPLAIDVSRAGQSATAMVLPQLDASKTYKIGVQFAGLPTLSERAVDGLEAIEDGFATAYTASVLTVKAFGAFLLKPFNSEQLAGPITIAKTAKASADRGWMAALAFVAGLSISVGVLNLLPIPMLDGGQILYHSVSRLISATGLRFKIANSEQINKGWTSIGVSFVVLLTMLALLTDFKRLFDF